MAIALNNLKKFKNSTKKKKRVGRGNASGHGTYSTRGMKGQRSRSGGKKGLTKRALGQLFRKTPKFKGQKTTHLKMEVVNLDVLENNFENEERVNSKILVSKNIIKSDSRGVKILGQGKLTKKLDVFADAFSQTAKEAIIKAGGQATTIKK